MNKWNFSSWFISCVELKEGNGLSKLSWLPIAFFGQKTAMTDNEKLCEFYDSDL